LCIIDEALADARLVIPPIEMPWLDPMRESLDEFAGLDGKRIDFYAAQFPDRFIPNEYGL
jgi:hypothetical protein